MDVTARFFWSEPGEELLTGTRTPNDLPLVEARTARLFQAMRAPASARELAGEKRAVATVATAMVDTTTSMSEFRSRRMHRQILTAKVAAAAAAVLFLGAGAAAASGSLPSPAQDATSAALARVGVDVPTADDNAPDDATSQGQGPDAAGPAQHGLCTAWAGGPPASNTHARRNSSVAFSNLKEAADDAGMSVDEYCVGVTSPDVDDPTEDPDGTTDPAADEGDQSGPPVSTPNSGGTGTGDQASNGNSGQGTDYAPPAAAAGSGNANDHADGRP